MEIQLKCWLRKGFGSILASFDFLTYTKFLLCFLSSLNTSILQYRYFKFKELKQQKEKLPGLYEVFD